MYVYTFKIAGMETARPRETSALDPGFVIYRGVSGAQSKGTDGFFVAPKWGENVGNSKGIQEIIGFSMVFDRNSLEFPWAKYIPSGYLT